MAETLIRDIIPRFGLPRCIQSDNGPAFISTVTQQVSRSLGIVWKLHIPYQPQSSGKVEWANGLIKDHLTKLSIETQLSWPQLLPLSLTRLRAIPRDPQASVHSNFYMGDLFSYPNPYQRYCPPPCFLPPIPHSTSPPTQATHGPQLAYSH